MCWRMLERGGDLEQLTSGGGIGGEGSSVVRCLHLTSSSVSRDEPNWTHPSVFERKKILVKNGILRSKKTDQIVCGYKAGPPFVRQRFELARLPVRRGPLLRTVINNLSLSLGLSHLWCNKT